MRPDVSQCSLAPDAAKTDSPFATIEIKRSVVKFVSDGVEPTSEDAFP